MMHLSSSITMESPSASTSTSPTTPPKQSRESRSLVCPTSVLPVITRLTFIRLRSEVRIRISFIIRKLVNMIFGAVVWSWRVPHWGVMWTAPSLRLWCWLYFPPCEDENRELPVWASDSVFWFQCVSTQTFVCSALPSTNVQWPNWRLSKSAFLTTF